MKNIIGVGATTVNNSVPQPEDGVDFETAASLDAGVQRQADNIKTLDDRTAELADLAALAAITTPANGLTRYVRGFGMYTFRTSATTGLSPFRVAAGDATAGGWVAGVAYETSRIIVVPAGRVRYITSGGSSGQAPADLAAGAMSIHKTIAAADAQFDGGNSFYPLVVCTAATNHVGWVIPLDEFLIHGATLSTATLKFTPVGGHGGLPTRQPRFGIARQVLTGYVPTLTALLSSTNGYVQLAAANLGAYENVNQSLVFTPNQNNVIDKLTYRYSAYILDEAGTNAIVGNAYNAIEIAHTAIPDARRG